MKKLNHRECFRKIMAGEATDWVPNYELGRWGQTTQRWLDEGMSEEEFYLGDWFEGEPFCQLDRRNFARLNTGMIPGFDPEVLEEDDEFIVSRGSNGITTRALKTGTVRGTRLCMDTYIDFPVKDRKSWEEVKKQYHAKTRVRYPFWWDEQVRLWKDRDYPVCLLSNGSFGLYSQLRSWVGTEKISYMFYDDPALVEEMLEFATDFLLELIDPALQQVEFDYFNFFEDCAGKRTPLFGPPVFKKFFMKPYKRIIERLNSAGINSIWVDCDGDPEVLIPLWMEAGINCLWPLEQASDMDPIRLREKFGKDLRLCGGIDKREIAKGKMAIDRELEKKIPPMLESGGFIPHIDHAVSPEISFDNFLYYIEKKRKLIGED